MRYASSALIFAAMAALLPLQARAQIITTFAGGETGPALSIPVSTYGVAVDAAGNVYVADELNHRVRKVSPSGIMTSVAGTGEPGFNADNIQAKSALLNAPRGVAVDGGGNLYIADRANNRIRKVSPAGIITTVAGSGTAGFAGDGAAASSAALNGPVAVAVSTAGEIFIADFRNDRVRRVAADGTIATHAGTGVAGFSGDGGPAINADIAGPNGLAIDAAGAVYFSEQANHRIRRVAIDGTITTYAGSGSNGFSGDSGSALAANLSLPAGLAMDASGNLYIADTNNDRIRRVSAAGIISTVAGSGIPGFGGDGRLAVIAALRNPGAVSVDGAGNLYIADVSNARVRQVNSAGVIASIAGNGRTGYGIGDGAAATAATMRGPSAVAFDASGNVYVADFYKHRVRKITPTGTISTVAGTGVPGSFGDGGAASSAQLYSPSGLAFDGNGNLYVSEFGGHRVRKITPAGTISTYAGSGAAGYGGDSGAAVTAALNSPWGLAVDGAGNLYIADRGNHRIRRVNLIGTIGTVAGNGSAGFAGDAGPATQAGLSAPQGVTVDANGNLWIADSGNHRIRRVSTSGVIDTVAGTGVAGFAGDSGAASNAKLNAPASIKFDAIGNAYVGDYANHRVRKITPTGVITTVVGDGSFRYAGDNGPALQASIANPYDAAIDVRGNLYVADAGNDRVRKVFLKPVSADFSADNKSDILFKDANGATGLVLMNGTTATASATVLSAGANWSVAHVADFDGDGRADLLIKNTDGRIAMLLMNGATVLSFNQLAAPGTGYAVALTGDFNADGRADVVLGNSDGSSTVLLMNGGGIVSAIPLLPAASAWRVTHVGDFNADGKSDLIVRNVDGSAAVLLMDGGGATAAGLLLGPGSPWAVAYVADLNGDAKSDIIIKNGDGSAVMLLMNGTAAIAANFLLTAGSPYSVTHTGDFNGDGKADIVIKHGDGSVVILLMNGTTVSNAAYFLTAGSTASIAQIGDYNGDGKSDILLINGDGSSTAVLMEGTVVAAFAGVWGPGTWVPAP